MVVLSIVIPIYNEAEVLEKNIKTVVNYMEKMDFSYEIIIAEDGSTDGSDKIADELSKEYETVRVSHLKGRAGRGMGLKRAFLNSNGEVLMYFDVDLSTEIKNIEKAVKIVKSSCDICIGSRLLPKSKTKRCLKREIASRGYNLFSRILFGSKITDLQCGFKAFKRGTLPILLKAENNHWFWDTEVLIKAEKEGKKIYQIPVKWKEDQDTKVNVIDSILGMGSRLLKLRIKLL